MHLLKVEGISKTQPSSFALKDIHFTQDLLQPIAIAGETGSGKTTLLRIIAGLVQPDSGTVWFNNSPVDGPDYQLVPGHPAIAYLSQHYELRNNYRVEELLSYANKLAPGQAEALYEVCRIDHLVKRRTDQLSGGEKQRIALARLLVGSPSLLLMDEPYSNLDPIHKNILKEVIRDLSERLSVTCLLTSHDPMDTLSWADEIIVMKDGMIVQKGQPEELYRKPINEYVAGLFGTYYLFTRAEAENFSLHNKIPEGKRLFIRPENIQFSWPGGNAMQAIVTHTRFWGAYYETEILLAGKTLSIRTLEPPPFKGDTVYVSLKAGEVWGV